MKELTIDERLVMAASMQKVLDHITDRNDPDSERAQLDAELLADYAAGRADRRPIRANGQKVAALCIRTTPAHTEGKLYKEDAAELLAWCFAPGEDGRPNAWAALEAFLSVPKCCETFLRFLADQTLLTGEVPAGCSYALEDCPEKVTTMLTGLKPEAVAQAFGAELPSAVAAMMLPEGRA